MMEQGDFALLWHAVDYWAAKKPDAEVLVYGQERMSWGRLKQEVDKAARTFLALGVERGDRIAMVSMGRPEFIITFMAAAKIGAIWLGLSPKYGIDEVRYIVGNAKPVILISVSNYQGIDLVDQGLSFEYEFPCIRHFMVIGACSAPQALDFQEELEQGYLEEEEALAERVAQLAPEDEVLLMYTSGSTGKPKGVLHTHTSILKNVAVEQEGFGWEESTRALLHFPINHVAADVELGYAALYAGAAIVFMERFHPQESLEVIAREKISVLGQVPTMYLLQQQTELFHQMDWSSVKAFVWGGSRASIGMLEGLCAIAKETGARLITGYGSTELGGFVSYTQPNESLERLQTSAGQVRPPYAMKIVDGQRKTLPLGQTGEIAFRGPVVMKGYLGNPSATAAVIDSEGWFYTGDLGYMDKEDYLYIVGRDSDMYKSGGENVFPCQVEEVLESHPAVLFAAVIGVPDAIYDEVGHAFLMLKPGKAVNEKDLDAYCKEHLANFKTPKQFEFRARLPLLPNGKVNKMALKADYEQGLHSGEAI